MFFKCKAPAVGYSSPLPTLPFWNTLLFPLRFSLPQTLLNCIVSTISTRYPLLPAFLRFRDSRTVSREDASAELLATNLQVPSVI